MNGALVLRIAGVLTGIGLAIWGLIKKNANSQAAITGTTSTSTTTNATKPNSVSTSVVSTISQAIVNSSGLEDVEKEKIATAQAEMRQALIQDPRNLYGNAVAFPSDGSAYWLDGEGKWVLLETIASGSYEKILATVPYVFCSTGNPNFNMIEGELRDHGNETFTWVMGINPLTASDAASLTASDAASLVQAMIAAGV